MRYSLDSNAVIALANRSSASLDARLMATVGGTVCLSSIVWFELAFGVFNSARVEANLRAFQSLALPVLAFETEDALAAGQLRVELRRKGTPIGGYDLLIAGQALARGLVVVTNNTREFARVPGLAVEDWTA